MDAIWAQLDLLLDKSNDEPCTNEYTCDACGGSKDMYAELPTCIQCGKVDVCFISDEPEWKGGIDDDGTVTDPSRVGAPTDDRFSEMWSLGTKINVYSHSSYAHKKMARISFHSSMNHKDRSLYHNYNTIEQAAKDIPMHVIKDAQMYYRKFSEEKLTRGAVRSGMKANCLLHACKKHKFTRSVAEIAESFGITTHDIQRTSDMFREVIKDNEVKFIQASDLVTRLFNTLKLSDDTKRRLKMKAIKMCETIQESDELVGKTPKTIAATVVYVVTSDFGVSMSDVCSACDVSSPTIKKIEILVRQVLKTHDK